MTDYGKPHTPVEVLDLVANELNHRFTDLCRQSAEIQTRMDEVTEAIKTVDQQRRWFERHQPKASASAMPDTTEQASDTDEPDGRAAK